MRETLLLAPAGALLHQIVSTPFTFMCARALDFVLLPWSARVAVQMESIWHAFLAIIAALHGILIVLAVSHLLSRYYARNPGAVRQPRSVRALLSNPRDFAFILNMLGSIIRIVWLFDPMSLRGIYPQQVSNTVLLRLPQIMWLVSFTMVRHGMQPFPCCVIRDTNVHTVAGTARADWAGVDVRGTLLRLDARALAGALCTQESPRHSVRPPVSCLAYVPSQGMAPSALRWLHRFLTVMVTIAVAASILSALEVKTDITGDIANGAVAITAFLLVVFGVTASYSVKHVLKQLRVSASRHQRAAFGRVRLRAFQLES